MNKCCLPGMKRFISSDRARFSFPSYQRPENWKEISHIISSVPIKSVVTTSGRVTSIRRASNSLWFCDLTQPPHSIQLILSKNLFHSKEEFDGLTLGALGRGDILQVSGLLDHSLTRELSIKVETGKIISSCQINIPKNNRLRDIEEKCRNRHLDLLSNDSTFSIFKNRSKIIGRLRKIMNELEFDEIETPVLSTKSTGASARPFETSSLNMIPLKLRIAPELYLKRAIIGGFQRVYEIGKVFRNEGIDRNHNPEFTICEFYEAYSSMVDIKAKLMEILRLLDQEYFEKEKFNQVVIVDELKRNLGTPPPLLDINHSLRELEELQSYAHGHGVDVKTNSSPSQIYDKLIQMHVEPKCKGLTFLLYHPILQSPLARRYHENPLLSDRFELLIEGGMEIANGYSELNDPQEQELRFQYQSKSVSYSKNNGDKNNNLEEGEIDEDFVDALRAGMPPTAGCGLGIDRIIMALTGMNNIRDVLLFPLLKPETNKKLMHNA